MAESTTTKNFISQDANQQKRCVTCGAFGAVKYCEKCLDDLHEAITFHKKDFSKPHPGSPTVDKEGIENITEPGRYGKR